MKFVMYSWHCNIPPKPGAEVVVVAAAPNAGVAGLLPKLKPLNNDKKYKSEFHNRE